MKTYATKASDIQRKWYVVDAQDQTLGRLATRVARILIGKHKPMYSPNMDTGDFVIVINAEKVVFTGKKWQQKHYAWYTGHPGQHRELAGRRLQRRPELILREAVRRMLPKNKLAFKQLAKLKIYVGSQHPHQAQQPQPKELGLK